jgi:predicted TIM-barrel fold metal-dependent hydrolase
MPESKWHEVTKIDFHAHVVLHERPESDLRLNLPDDMVTTMDAHNVERAVILPINWSEYFPLTLDERADWLAANNSRQAALAAASGGRFVAFADLALGDVYSPQRVATELVRAASELGLRGLKIHPTDLGVPADDLRLVPVLRQAADLGLPVMVHSYPSDSGPSFDYSAPHRIARMMAVFPDVTWIIAHLGGVRFMDVIPLEAYVDISGMLLGVSDLYDLAFAERLLRRIGLERVLFGTDFPVFPYERYYEVLDQMHFIDEEIEQIAYRNAAGILQGGSDHGQHMGHRGEYVDVRKKK